MRPNGVTDSATGLLPWGHLCWSYHGRADLLARAREYVADGVVAGQWIEYVGAGEPGELQAELAAVAGEELLDHDGFTVRPIEEFYAFESPGLVDPVCSVAKRLAATEKAVAEGWTGFRAVVDVTSAAGTPEQREAFARFEYLIDEQMAQQPVTALCAFDQSLGDESVAEVASLHPWINDGAAPFRLFTNADGRGLALAGEIDLFDATLFAATLDRIAAVCDAARIVVDVEGVDYMDHRALLAFDRCALRHGRKVVVRGGTATMARVAEMLDLDRVLVEVAPG